MRSNKTTMLNVNDDQQPEFRGLTELYIVIFLNNLKIVENPPKERENLKIRMLMANAMEPFRDSHSSSWFSGSWIDVSVEPPSHRPCT